MQLQRRDKRRTIGDAPLLRLDVREALSELVVAMEELEVDRSRREFLVKAAYTAPVIVTLSVIPSVASAGSEALTSASGPSTKKHHHNNNNHWW